MKPASKKIFLTLTFICLLVYANALSNGFVSDDFDSIVRNRILAHPPAYYGLYPSLIFNFLIFLVAKLNPFLYHLVNILLHALVTVMVFLLLRLFFKTSSSFLASCLFAVHPVHVEAVTWISGRPYIITAFFVLAGYFLYYVAVGSINPLRVDEKEGPPLLQKRSLDARFKITPYVICLLFFSYYMIGNFNFYFLFPFLLVLSDISLGLWRKNYKKWIPFFAIAFVRMSLATSIISKRITDVKIDVGVSSVKNPVIFFVYSFFTHLKLFIWPDKLTFYHDPSFAPAFLLHYNLLIFLPILIFLFLVFKKARLFFFGISFFILFLAPTYSPIPVSALIAERYVYIPSIGLSLCAAFLYEKGAARFRAARNGILALFIFVCLAYAFRTVVRNKDWKDEDTFWKKTLQTSAYSPRAHNNMGIVYIREKKYEKAVAEFEKASQLDPEYALAYFNLGDLYTLLGKKDLAMDFYNKAIQLRPWYQNTYNNLGALQINIGQNQGAVPLLLKAIELDPDFAAAHFNLAVAYYNLKEYALAIKHYDRAIQLGFDMPEELSRVLEPYRK